MTLRRDNRLHHIGLGRRYAGTPVLVLVHDLHVRVLSTSGQLLRDLHLGPSRDYRPQAVRRAALAQREPAIGASVCVSVGGVTVEDR